MRTQFNPLSIFREWEYLCALEKGSNQNGRIQNHQF